MQRLFSLRNVSLIMNFGLLSDRFFRFFSNFFFVFRKKFIHKFARRQNKIQKNQNTAKMRQNTNKRIFEKKNYQIYQNTTIFFAIFWIIRL